MATVGAAAESWQVRLYPASQWLDVQFPAGQGAGFCAEEQVVTLQVSSEVQKLLAEQMATGRFADANDVLLDALKRQRQLQEGDGPFEDDWPAIREALDDIAAGDQGRPAEEVLAALRRKHSL